MNLYRLWVPRTYLPTSRPSLRRSSSNYHSLTFPSSYIRPLNPGTNSTADSPSKQLENDFALHPNYYTLPECKELLAAGLWKLDRSDTTLRRRRGKSISNSVGSEGNIQGLQDLFHGEYGFEEVCIYFFEYSMS